jgi:RNA polymerase sigma-70 factor (family 1)
MRLTESPEVTEDIIQDIFLKLWKNHTRLSSIEHFSSYIFRMAQNQCISHFKRMAKETLILKGLQNDPISMGTDAENNLGARETQQKLQEMLARLTPQQRLVFMLSREQGLRHEEIARQLGITPSTVKNHMIQALGILRQQLSTYRNTAVHIVWILLIMKVIEKYF